MFTNLIFSIFEHTNTVVHSVLYCCIVEKIIQVENLNERF